MDELNFTVDSALLNELGERLVESVHVALIELVKNSYDADATEVTISFSETDSGEFQLSIADNGRGMSFKDVKSYWMRIATTNKLLDSVSLSYGRPKSGSKGIGRFSCRRLGNKLELVTIAQISNEKKFNYEKTNVYFEWENFSPGTEVTNIKCPGKRQRIKKAKPGTTLIISGGNGNEWGLRSYNVLKRHLSVLVANRGIKRKGFKKDPGFNITINAPNFTDKTKDLREDLINAGWGTISAEIENNGQATYTLNAMDLGKKQITGERVYNFLSGVSLKIGIFVADRSQIRDTSVLSKSGMSKILKEWGGVQVRFNGVRIQPYGDIDWLNIDLDRARRLGAAEKELQAFANGLEGVSAKRALLSLLSHKSYLGTVDIDSINGEFQPKINREGFMETPAVEELRHFVRYGIDWATIYRDYWIREEKKKAAIKAHIEFNKVSGMDTPRSDIIKSAAIYIKDQVSRIAVTPSEDERVSTSKGINTAISAILEQNKEDEDELYHLRLITSNTILLLIFSHEVKSFLSDIDNTEGMVELMLEDSRNISKTDLISFQSQLADSKSRFEQLLEMTALIGVDAKKYKPVRLSVQDRVEKAISCFNLVISNYNIDVDISEIPINLMVGPLMESELYAILLNALSNSIKSVIAAGKRKQIALSASREKNKTKIVISDTGIGIDSNIFDEVFIPFIADPHAKLYPKLDDKLNPADKYIVGTGSGLGLSIVKEIVTKCDGTIRFIEPKKPWKAQLEVLLP